MNNKQTLFDVAYQKGYESGIDGLIEANPYSSDEGKAGYIAGRRDGEAYYRQYPAYEEDPCPRCGGTVGHRVNCPDGIAFSE